MTRGTSTMPYRIAVLAALFIALLLLSGCSKKYTFNFKTEMDAVNLEGAWYESGELGYTDLGAYLEGGALVSPFRFGGDFKVEIDFYTNIGNENFLDWLEFYIIDTDDWNYDAWIGLGMHMLSPTQGTYWVGQKDSFTDNLTAPFPGFVAEGLNKMTIRKAGNKVYLKLGNNSYAPITISTANSVDYYNFIMVGYDDGNSIGKGVYIEKVVVTYGEGNRVSVTP